MEMLVYDDLEICRNFAEIDCILERHGYTTALEKYTYLINRMGIVFAEFMGIDESDIDSMYVFAKENFLLNHWRD
jgi:hypothetical protein